MMDFVLWTDDPALARAASAAGVSRIGPDLEIAGKAARQAGMDSLQSHHSADCLPAIRAEVGCDRLFVRCNPPAVARGREIEALLEQGVRSIMLPMLRSVADAELIARQIRGRAELMLMIEHADALPLCDTLAQIEGVRALYVGANDLALSLNLPSRFAVMTPSILDPLAAVAQARGLHFGFFGLARAGDSTLPVPSDLVIAEWVRLGADFCVLARSFHAAPHTLANELARVRARIVAWHRADAGARAGAHHEFLRCCELANDMLAVTSGATASAH